MNICPNLHNKLVKELFDRLVDALGRPAAYLVWDLTDGNGVEVEADGSPSFRFQQLLKRFNNRKSAAVLFAAREVLSSAQIAEDHVNELKQIYQTAVQNGTWLKAPNGLNTKLTPILWLEVRSINFKKWFGDWENDPENSSKAIDPITKEPMILYHGSGLIFSEFKLTGDTNTDSGYYTDKKTGEKIPFDTNGTYFFSTEKYTAYSYQALAATHKANKIIDIIRDLISNNGVRHHQEGKDIMMSESTYKLINGNLLELLHVLKEASKYWYEARGLYLYISDVKISGKTALTSTKVRERFIEVLRNTLNKLESKLDSQSIMVDSDWEYHNAKALDILDYYNNNDGINKLKSGEIPDVIKKKFYYDHNVRLNNFDMSEFIFYGDIILEYNKDNGLSWRNVHSNKSTFFTKMSTLEIGNILNSMLKSLSNDINERRANGSYEFVKKEGAVYPVFLNVRNPLSHDYDGTMQGSGYKGSKKYSFGYVAARLVKKARENGNDGVVYENLFDPTLANNWGVFDSNQIKSAQFNSGNYSKLDNNMFNQASVNLHNYKLIQEESDKYQQLLMLLLIESKPDITDEEISQAASKFALQWAKLREGQILGDIQQLLIQTFGLKRNIDGTLSADTPNGKLIVRFVNSLGVDENGNTIKGQIDSTNRKLRVISIALNAADATTMNHELAHEYIQMFWDSKPVQDALKHVYKEGMTQRLLEEALVDAITDVTIDSQFMVRRANRTWVDKFWDAFNRFLHKLFHVRSELVKQQMIDNISAAFMVNQQLELANDAVRFHRSFADNVMYQTAEQRSRLNERRVETEKSILTAALDKYGVVPVDEQIAELIVKSTISKQQAYSRRIKQTESGIARLSKAVFLARTHAKELRDARLAKNANDQLKAKLSIFKDFVSLASVDLVESFEFLEKALASEWRYIISKNVGGREVLVDNPEYDASGNETTTTRLITFQMLLDIKHDVLGYYENLLHSIVEMCDDASRNYYDATNGSIKGKYSAFSSEIDALRSEAQNAQEYVNKLKSQYDNAIKANALRFLYDYIDQNVDLDENYRIRMKQNVAKWLEDNPEFAGLGWQEKFGAGINTQSESPLIRIIQNMMDDMEGLILDDEFEAQTKIVEAYQKAVNSNWTKGKFDPRDFHKMFMERDRNGVFTGNFVQKINVGQHQQDLDNLKDELMFGNRRGGNYESLVQQRHGNSDEMLLVDNYGNPIFPDDCFDLEKQYYLEIEDWHEKHSTRRYKSAYYRARLQMLSVPTLRAYREIQNLIGDITRTCLVNGRPRTDLLSPEQLAQVRVLEKQRDNLSNPYNEDGTKKTGDAYDMAIEIYNFNKEVSEHIKRTVDLDAYNEARSHAKNKEAFDRANTVLMINPKAHEYLDQIFVRPDLPEAVKLAIYSRNKLISIVKEKGFVTPRFNELWESGRYATSTARDIFAEIKRLDQFIADNRLKSKLRDKSNGLTYESVFSSEEYEDEHGKSYHSTIQTEASRAPGAMPGESALFNYQNQSGEMVPTSVFTYSLPVGHQEAVDFNTPTDYIPQTYKDAGGNEYRLMNENRLTGEMYDTFIRMPISLYQKVDIAASNALPDSWVDNNWDETNARPTLPNVSEYTNEDYVKYIENGTPEVLDYYNLLVDTMREAYKNISFLSDYDMRLPQIEGGTVDRMVRQPNVFKSAWHCIKHGLSINESDTEFTGEDLQTRPDGTRISNIPTRFIRRVEDPMYVSADLAFTVSQFYKMAKNYLVKANNYQPIEAMIEVVASSNTAESSKDSPQLKQLRYMLERNVFGRETSTERRRAKDLDPKTLKDKSWAGRQFEKFKADYERKLYKYSGAVRNLANKGALALNVISALVSFLDPYVYYAGEALSGRYFGLKDSLKSLGIDMPFEGLRGILNGALHMFSSGSNLRYTNKISALMGRFKVGENIGETLRYSNDNNFLRWLRKGPGMWIYSIGDYTIHAMTLTSIMHNTKLYIHSTGQREFLSKDLWFKAYSREYGVSNRRAIKAEYRKAKDLYSAYEFKNGQAVVKDQYKDIILENDGSGNYKQGRFENEIRKLSTQKATQATLMPDDTQTTRLQTHAWGRWVMALRTFLAMGIRQRFMTGHDFFNPNRTMIENGPNAGNYKSNPDTSNRYYAGMYDFRSNTIATGYYPALFQFFRHIKSNAKYLTFLASSGLASQSDIAEAYRRKNGISRADLYGAARMGIDMAFTFALYMVLPLIFSAFQPDDDDSKIQRWFKRAVRLTMLRLYIEKLTFVNPGTIFEIVTNITTSITDIKRKSSIVSGLLDLLGLSGHSPEEEIKQGAFTGYKRWQRDAAKITSPLGTYNAMTNFSEKGLESKEKWYKGHVHNPENNAVWQLLDWQEPPSSKENKKKSSSNSRGGRRGSGRNSDRRGSSR